MGKKQHQKDRLWLTTKEWKEEWGGFKGKSRAPFSRLPFHCCALSFLPFEDPVCTVDGTTFDIVNLVPYIQKYRKHPVTGEPLSLKDVVPLKFHKNADGEYHCPVLNKVFTKHSHIVAIRPTGNVFSYEAVEELNIKPKLWQDLLTDELFKRADIIHLQDPQNTRKGQLAEFDHVKKDLTVDTGEQESSLRNVNATTQVALKKLQEGGEAAALAAGGGDTTRKAQAQRLLDEALLKKGGLSGNKGGPDPRLKVQPRSLSQPKFKPGAITWDTEDYNDPEVKRKEAKLSKAIAKELGTSNAGTNERNGGRPSPQELYEKRHARYEVSNTTTGTMAASFTSTSSAITTTSTREMKRIYLNPTKKGYLRLHTSRGDLNLELHCDLAPRTCENFIFLASIGYYDNTIFHRSIKNFMIQGGDPTGTGTGGESIYGPTFRDELDSRLTHASRGVVSMANSGKDTNGSQFFITYKSAHHLDFKHSVFGKVVGGLEVLTAMERTLCDSDDRPLEEIRLTGVSIYTDPFKEMEADEQAKAQQKAEQEAAAAGQEEKEFGEWFSNPAGAASGTASQQGVGKYLRTDAFKARAPAGAETEAAAPKKKKLKSSTQQLTDFDAW